MGRTVYVWSEGDGAPDPGYNDGHTLGTYHGSANADTLQEAADKVFHMDESGCYDRERMTYWGYALFEREPQYV